MSNLTIKEELAIIIKENQNNFYRLAYRYMRSEDDSIDIVQDAILKAFESIETLKHREYMKTWFYRILINECVSKMRKNNKIVFINDYKDIPYEDNKFDEKQNKLALFNAIENLDEKYKSVIILRFYEELKLEQIAYILNINVNTVKSRLYRALDILKIDLKDDIRLINN